MRIDIQRESKEKGVTESTAISGKSSVFPMKHSAVETKEVTNNPNGNLVMRNISRGKKREELGPDTLVLPSGSNSVSPEGHIRSILGHAPGVESQPHSLHT